MHSIERIWDDVAPTPEEFSHDIDGFPMVLDAIIEAKGVSVEDKEIHKGGGGTRGGVQRREHGAAGESAAAQAPEEGHAQGGAPCNPP